MALTKIPASLLDTSSGINGLIYPTSDGTSGQFLKTDGSGNLTFATTYTDSDVETYLDGGSSTPTFASATVSGTLTVTGDLDITGDINSYNVTDLDVADKTITLGAGQTEANSGGSGIIIDGSSASILWDETNDKFDLSHGLHIGDSAAIGDATTPALQIGGTTTYRLGMYTTAEGAIIDNANGDDGIIFHTKNANEAMRIDASGNVGIGTSSPAAPLDVAGNFIFKSPANTLYGNFDNTTAGYGAFRLQNLGSNYGFIGQTSSLLASGGSNTALGLRSENEFAIATGGSSERFRIDSSGNVGIGTSSPSAKLEVIHGNVSQGNGVTFGRTASQSWDFWGDSGANVLYSKGNFAIIGTSDSQDLSFRTNNTDRMRIDASGNVGIGETSPAKLGLTGSSTGKVLALGGDDCQLRLTYTVLHHDHSGNTTTHLRNHYGSLDALARMKLESGYISFHTGTAFTEGMRIDSAGRVLINQTSSNLTYGKLQVSAGGETAGFGGIVAFFDTDVSVASSNLIQLLQFSGDTDATGGQFIRFSDSNSTMGSVSAASGTTVSYNTSSDRRMKENIVDASSQLDVINNIQIKEFDWIKNGHHEVGVIAQELNEVIPNVVQEGGEDVNEEPWGVDYGKLTPYLIKAMQEQQTIIDDLKSRIETLEG
jgi:hypothetical protein